MHDLPLLFRVGEALYGSRWQTDLAGDVGVSDRTMRRWAANGTDIPLGAWRDLYRCLDTRFADLGRLKERLSGLLGVRSFDGDFDLRPVPNGRREFQIDGVYFAMQSSAGKTFDCFASRGIFDSHGCSTREQVLAFFDACSQSFYRAASVKLELGEDYDGQLRIGPSDVIAVPNP